MIYKQKSITYPRGRVTQKLKTKVKNLIINQIFLFYFCSLMAAILRR